MIVECSHCHTKFNLPDDKVKPGGVKIRCTRCKNVFEVLPPGQSAPQEDSFSAGLDDDLSGFGEGDSGISSEGAADSDIPGDLDRDLGGNDFGLDSGDSDFDLDSDLDIGAEDTKPADSDSLEFEMDSDARTAPDAGKGADSAGPARTATAADSDFDLDKDLDADLGDLDLSFDDAPAPAANKAAPDAGTDFDLSFGGETAAKTVDTAPAPAPRPAAQPAPPPTAPTIPGDDFGIGDDSLIGGADDLGFGDSIGIEGREAPFADLEEPGPKARPKKKAARRSPLTVALLILLFLLAGGYWAYSTYFSQGFDPDKILSLFSGNEDPLANLENAEMKMRYYYVVNAEAGKILVLEGVVINHSNFDKGRIKVRVTLSDKAGKALGTSDSYCGNILDVSELETLPKKDIVKLLTVEAGKKFDNAHIKSNESIPYMLVVFSVPQATDGFVVTVVGAQNVGK